MGFGNSAPGITGFFIFSFKTIHTYYFISFEKNLKKLPNVKSQRQNAKEMTICIERIMKIYENVE